MDQLARKGMKQRPRESTAEELRGPNRAEEKWRDPFRQSHSCETLVRRQHVDLMSRRGVELMLPCRL